jgi:capsular exopolysaccharide synthesis family protein
MIIFAWGYLQLATPVYEAKATLLIQDEKKGVHDPTMIEALNFYTSKKIVENEIEVIKSKTILKETARLLHLCSPVYEEGIFLSMPAFSSSPLLVEVMDIDSLRDQERLDFFFNKENQSVQVAGQFHQIDSWFHTPFGEIRFVKNPNQDREAFGQLFVLLINPRIVVNDLVDNLKVEPSSKLSTLINLSIRDAEPARAEIILNMIIARYNTETINNKNSLASTTLSFIEERISIVERELDSLERSIEAYKSTQGVVDLSEQGKVFLNNVGDNDQRLSELEMQLATLQQLEGHVRSKESSNSIVPGALGINDVSLTALVSKLFDAETEYARLSQTTAENNPVLISLGEQISNLRPGILENIQNQKDAIITARSKLSAANARYKAILSTIPRKEQELLEASRQQSIKNNVYTFLLQKREETSLASGTTEADTRLVDEAEATLMPVFPNKPITYLAAIFLGCVLAAGWVIKKEVLSNKVLFRSEIESATPIAVAAEIVDSNSKKYIVIDDLDKPHIADQFLQLRAAIGSKKKVIVITSSIAGEGKSFICANFAMSLAEANKRILLIDMDLRSPRLSHLYKIDKATGMVEYLQGRVAVERIIRRTITKNLYLVGAGQSLGGAAKRLLDLDFSDLFKKLRENFDYVIVDTPPIIPVPDTRLVIPHADALLYVVRHGKTPKKLLTTFHQYIETDAKKVLIVFNGVKQRGFFRDGQGYGYGYSYEYSYPSYYNDGTKW